MYDKALWEGYLLRVAVVINRRRWGRWNIEDKDTTGKTKLRDFSGARKEGELLDREKRG